MDPILKWRKSQPAPSSTIPYGRFSRDVDGIVYSIDMFRPRFPLAWQKLRVRSSVDPDKFLPLTDDNVLWAFKEQVIFPLCELLPSPSNGEGRIGVNLHWWSFGGVRITLQKFKPFCSDDFNYSCLLEFNPNKYLDSPVILPLIQKVKVITGDRFCWRNTRTDYTVDVPYVIRDVRLLTRKVGSSYNGTYYFGSRGSSGYTRVYDKRREMLEHYNKDIGCDVTRIEYELRSGVPAVLDPPYLLPSDLGRYEILRYVAMADLIPALRTFDERTSSKIKRDLLKKLPFDASIFDDLFAGLLVYLGLDPSDCIDHWEKNQLDSALAVAEASELEKLMSALRRMTDSFD